MIPRQRRGLFNFLCAFMPGASEMYMGFMKMGVSLMLAFMGGIMAIGFLDLSDAFVAIPAVMWFYGFFHARNLTSCPPEAFARIKDDYFWNEFVDGSKFNIRSESARKVIAWILIIIGVSTLWNIGKGSVTWLVEYMAPGFAGVIYNVFDALPKMLIAAIIIFVGLTLISGKKKELFITDKSYDFGSRKDFPDFATAPSGPSFSSPVAPTMQNFTASAPTAPDFSAKTPAPDFSNKTTSAPDNTDNVKPTLEFGDKTSDVAVQKAENESSDNTNEEEKMDA